MTESVRPEGKSFVELDFFHFGQSKIKKLQRLMHWPVLFNAVGVRSKTRVYRLAHNPKF